MLGEATGKRGYRGVQHRDAPLETYAHRRTVHFHEDIVRQVEEGIGAHHPFRKISESWAVTAKKRVLRLRDPHDWTWIAPSGKKSKKKRVLIANTQHFGEL